MRKTIEEMIKMQEKQVRRKEDLNVESSQAKENIKRLEKHKITNIIEKSGMKIENNIEINIKRKLTNRLQ